MKFGIRSIFCLLLLLIVGCNPAATTPVPNERPTTEGATEGATPRVVVLLGGGGRGDNSFNDSAASALPRLSELGVEVVFEDRPTEGSTDEIKAQQLQMIQARLDEGYNLIIGMGFENQGIIVEAAKAHPETRFALIDVTVADPPSNITSITFREQEGDYILGVLAARLTENGRVGFIGGAAIPVIERIQNGYTLGVANGTAEGDVEVMAELVGSFTDTVKAGEIATAMFTGETPVDVVYVAAGGAGNEAIKVAVENEILVLSTSTTINLPPGVVAARPKRVDAAVVSLVEHFMNSNLTPAYTMGYREGGLGLAFDDSVDTKLEQEMLALQKSIETGNLVVELATDGVTVSVHDK
ncbi:MAG: BMP family ABC transporter substrate-binding protein [Ardenticatenales bacterium]|nr:BMP family ABC transporter substrate-binding protein [Ardenticatenales bacterium]